MKIPIRQLESDRLILRSFNQSDLEPLLHYRGDPGVAKYQLWQPFTREMALDFIIKYKSPGSFVPEKWFGIAIALKKSNALIGDFAIKIVGKDYSQAEIGFNLSPKFQKQGYATEAAICILDYLFKELKLHRVYAVTDSQNNAANILLEKLHMRREGHFMQNVWFKDHWGDEFHYAILREEWLSK
jgi:RimJ/RimL family protein N-acetyltransferase